MHTFTKLEVCWSYWKRTFDNKRRNLSPGMYRGFVSFLCHKELGFAAPSRARGFAFERLRTSCGGRGVSFGGIPDGILKGITDWSQKDLAWCFWGRRASYCKSGPPRQPPVCERTKNFFIGYDQTADAMSSSKRPACCLRAPLRQSRGAQHPTPLPRS